MHRSWPYDAIRVCMGLVVLSFQYQRCAPRISCLVICCPDLHFNWRNLAHPDLQQRRKDKMTDIWELLTDAQRRAEASAKRIKPVPKQGTLTAWLKPVPKCKPPWHKPVQPSVQLSKDMVVNSQGKRVREQKTEEHWLMPRACHTIVVLLCIH